MLIAETDIYGGLEGFILSAKDTVYGDTDVRLEPVIKAKEDQ